jgi:hypothetical protein
MGAMLNKLPFSRELPANGWSIRDVQKVSFLLSFLFENLSDNQLMTTEKNYLKQLLSLPYPAIFTVSQKVASENTFH